MVHNVRRWRVDIRWVRSCHIDMQWLHPQTFWGIISDSFPSVVDWTAVSNWSSTKHVTQGPGSFMTFQDLKIYQQYWISHYDNPIWYWYYSWSTFYYYWYIHWELESHWDIPMYGHWLQFSLNIFQPLPCQNKKMHQFCWDRNLTAEPIPNHQTTCAANLLGCVHYI